MVSISSIEKDYAIIIWDSLQDCILNWKIENQMHTKFNERKNLKQPVVALLDNNCSLRHMFYTKFIPWSVPKTLEKYLPSSSFLVNLKTGDLQLYQKPFSGKISLFQEKIHIHMENLPNSCFYCSYFTPVPPNRNFIELLLLAACKISQHGNWSPFGIQIKTCHRKINKIYRRKLKPSRR